MEGYGLIGNKSYLLAIFKNSKNKFRPSQADPLHFDLWLNGINLLRDGGTYTYSKSSRYLEYFGGIQVIIQPNLMIKNQCEE